MGLQTIKDDVNYLISNGKTLSFWNDHWLDGKALTDYMEIPMELQHTKTATVEQMIHNGQWHIPRVIRQGYPEIAEQILDIEFGAEEADRAVWMGSKGGF